MLVVRNQKNTYNIKMRLLLFYETISYNSVKHIFLEAIYNYNVHVDVTLEVTSI